MPAAPFLLPALSGSLATLLLASSPALAAAPQDWTNLGGNEARNGRNLAAGPEAGNLLWSAADPSIISWAPFIHDRKVFTVRQTGFPASGGPANDAVKAWDLDTGTLLWSVTLPYGGDPNREWIAWIAGVRDGRVYASRASQGKPGPVLALDAASGAILWTSSATTEAFAYDGVVFAPDGDLLVGDATSVVRIDAGTGATVWTASRTCAVSGNCGVAVGNGGVYLDEVAAGGQVVTKLDLDTGAALYQSSLMPGFTVQNSPFVLPDGTVCLARTQNNPSTDFLYAFDDTGAALVERWHVPIRWTTSHTHGAGADSSIYTFLPNDEFVRLDPATGAVLASAGVIAPLGSPNASPRTAVDVNGIVYLSNGWADNPPANGHLWAFLPNLNAILFDYPLFSPNQGGPALGPDGTLVVCDLNGVYAHRDLCPLRLEIAGPGGGPPQAGGPVTVTVTCASPNQRVLVAAATATGRTRTSGCPVRWDLDRPREFPIPTDATGTATAAGTLPAKLAGWTLYVQAMDDLSCRRTGVARLEL